MTYYGEGYPGGSRYGSQLLSSRTRAQRSQLLSQVCRDRNPMLPAKRRILRNPANPRRQQVERTKTPWSRTTIENLLVGDDPNTKMRRSAVAKLKRRDPASAVTLLTGLVPIFDNGNFWIRKNDGAYGNRCLVGGIEEVRQAYSLKNSEPAYYYLGQVIDPNSGVGGNAGSLAAWNANCPSFGELKRVIGQAHALASADMQQLEREEAALPPEPRNRGLFGG